jgi:multiple sugar transport system permease protein
MKYKDVFPKAYLTIGAILILLPIFWTFTTSFKTPPEIMKVPPTILPQSFANLSNYSEVFKELHFARLLLNTFFMCAVVVAFSLLFASLAGYGFAKFNFKGKEFFFYGIVVILMIPFQSVAVPLFHWMDKLNMIDTFAGLVLPLLISAFGMPPELTDVPS